MRRKAPHHGLFALGITLLAAGAAAQHGPDPVAPANTPAEQKRGSKEAPTHRPAPDLPPLAVLEHLREGNRAAVAARAAGAGAPPPRERPAGAGRYLCAVLACADADLDVPALFGLARKEVLVLTAPGPFASRETVALLEHFVAAERLPLILVLTHAECATLAMRAGATPQQDGVAKRVEEVRQQARTAGHPLAKALARAQREQLLAASTVLSAAVAADQTRILAAEVDDQSGAVTWHVRNGEELALPAVR